MSQDAAAPDAGPGSSRKVRILVAKPGLDGHDRGAKVVARALRDAGFEVIYTGLHQTPEMIANAVVQEDVDGVGLSIMSGAHNTLFPAVIDALNAKGVTDVVIFGGGIIPEGDLERLRSAGVKGVFTPGTTLETIIGWVRENVRPKA
ncbi:MAG: putative isobutyryl-CoA mutase, chain [Labilithrix sp.]|nr:putative isobutyryl-CoA mutase, chain [Labilithrix sp.]